MKSALLTLIISLSFLSAYNQNFNAGVMAGIANYQGDLADLPFKPARFAAGIRAGYEISDRLMLRSGFLIGKVAGGDKYGGNDFQRQTRNLGFESVIKELNLLAELTLFNRTNLNWSPYVFGGVAVFKFNPYTFDANNNKVYLKPLSTEGQGWRLTRPGSRILYYNLPFRLAAALNLHLAIILILVWNSDFANCLPTIWMTSAPRM